MASEKVRQVQELRRSSAALPIPSKKRYSRREKYPAIQHATDKKENHS